MQTVKELAEVGIECEPIRVDDFTGKKMTFFHDPDGLPLELSIPIKTSTFFGNSEHSFPEKQSIPFRNRVQFIF